MPDLNVTWGKCGDDNHWCNFHNLDLNGNTFNNLQGVYIIWSSGGNVVRVGSGVIKDRIADHRNDAQITAHQNLLVTWAGVNANQMQGVEKYLADTYNPVVGERFPNRVAISVNHPW